MENNNDRPNPSLRELLYPYISRKAESFFLDNKNKLTIQNFPKKPSLILATHPTIEDSHIWRMEPTAIHAVHAEALKKTGVTALDRMIALHYSRMIPVYTEEDRKRTYEDISSLIKSGYSVVVNPTGKTSGSNDIPPAEEIKVGAIIRPWQLSGGSFDIVPAYIKVDEITDDYKIAKGSNITVSLDVNPLDVSTIFSTDKDMDKDKFTLQLIEKWQQLAQNLTQTAE